MRSSGLNAPPDADYFLPALQRPETFTNILVRTNVGATAMAAAVMVASLATGLFVANRERAIAHKVLAHGKPDIDDSVTLWRPTITMAARWTDARVNDRFEPPNEHTGHRASVHAVRWPGTRATHPRSSSSDRHETHHQAPGQDAATSFQPAGDSLADTVSQCLMDRR